MKWVFLAGAVFASLLSVLAWMTQPKQSAAGQPVQLIWATDPNPARAAQIALFEDWHQRTYGERITVKTDANNYDISKVIIQSLAGSGPDLFDYYNGAGDLERYVRSGIILDVTDYAAQRGFGPEILWPAAHPMVLHHGRQYGVPCNVAANAMIYHRDLFDAQGLPYPRRGWTWEEFLVVARKLTHATGPFAQRRFALLTIDPLIMVASNGARFFSPDGTRCVLDSPEAVEALTFYHALRVTHRVMPASSDLASMAAAGGWGGQYSVFAQRRIAMTSMGRFSLIRFVQDQQQGQALRLGIADLPRFKHRAALVYGRATGINSKGRHRQYALRFLEYLASEEYNRLINGSYDGLGAVARYAFGKDGIAGETPPPAGLEVVNASVWTDAMQYGQGVETTPFIPPYQVSKIWNDQVALLEMGKQSPAATIRRCARLLNAEIQQNIHADDRLRALYEAARRPAPQAH